MSKKTASSSSSSSHKNRNLYMKNILTRKINLHVTEIGSNIKQNIQKKISLEVEGKCIIDGFIKPNSVNILSYSSGLLQQENVHFDVSFECLVCRPVEGMKLQCIVKNIAKGGIRAEINEAISPVVVFIARDHHYQSKYFSTIKENDTINVSVVGQRYELNDKYVSIIAELIEPKKPAKVKLVIAEN